MAKRISITIDGKKIRCEEGESVLEVAKRAGINIPTLCYHPDLNIKASCRLCVVQQKGKSSMDPACATKVADGMELSTATPAINKVRKTNLELLFSQHCLECQDCIWNYNCKLRDLSQEYGAKISRFPDRKNKKDYPTYTFGPSLQFDSSKCIDCRNCVEACALQGVNFMEVREKGDLWETVPTNDKNIDCIYCGQCITHCPVGAFEAVGEFEEVHDPLKDKSKTVVFQFAPSIRASIGEEFGLPHGSVVTDQLVAGIRKLGADYVFDVSVGADVTTIEESRELIERVESGHGLPMFTSCCPAWVKFVEFYRPDLIPNLTTVRSPHIISGALTKTYWAKKMDMNPRDISVVSIMPCVSKKYEAQRRELTIRGHKAIDYVLTTRELAYLFSKNKVDLKTIKPEKADSPMGKPSGAGVIYGASGGVMESALRTAYEKLTNKPLGAVTFKEVKGLEGVREAAVRVKGKMLRVAVVNGMGNAKGLLEFIKEKPDHYTYIEVMACPGGCIGGGGQPVPVNEEIRQARKNALFSIDKSNKIRVAHKNPEVMELYEEYMNSDDIIRPICYTTFRKKKKEVKFKRV